MEPRSKSPKKKRSSPKTGLFSYFGPDLMGEITSKLDLDSLVNLEKTGKSMKKLIESTPYETGKISFKIVDVDSLFERSKLVIKYQSSVSKGVGLKFKFVCPYPKLKQIGTSIDDLPDRYLDDLPDRYHLYNFLDNIKNNRKRDQALVFTCKSYFYKKGTTEITDNYVKAEGIRIDNVDILSVSYLYIIFRNNKIHLSLGEEDDLIDETIKFETPNLKLSDWVSALNELANILIETDEITDRLNNRASYGF